jgi:lipopolysaccharide transport system permease protein
MAVTTSLLLEPKWIRYSTHFLRQEIARQFDRSVLGYTWLFITQIVTIFGIAFVWTTLFRADISKFFPYLSSSIAAWSLISGIISEGPRVYHSAGPILQSFNIPPASFALRMVLRYYVVFLYALPVHAMVLLYFGINPFPALFALIPNAILLFLLLYPVANALGIAGARFRDLAPATSSLIYIAFLISPILYEPASIPDRAFLVVALNPFYYLLELVRRPLLGQMPDVGVYLVVVGSAIIAWAASAWINSRYGRYLVFWA